MSRNNMFYWQADRPYTAQQIKEIFLDRKEDYDPSLVTVAAEKAMKESIKELQLPINFGSVNIVCPFITDTGREGVIRVHPKQVVNEYFYVESEAMKLAASVGVPVPKTITVDCTRKIVPFDYMVTTKVTGEVMQPVIEREPDKHLSYLEKIGEYLGNLHSLKTTGYGFFDNTLASEGNLKGIHNTNEEHFLAALDEDEKFYSVSGDQVDVKLTEQAIKILRASSNIASCSSPTLVHNDIADWNTIVIGDKVNGILDWDECFSGDPMFEFATLSLFYTDNQMEAIKTGYVKTNTLPADYEKKFELYVLRYIISKSKISIKKLQFQEKESTRKRFELAKAKLAILVPKLS